MNKISNLLETVLWKRKNKEIFTNLILINLYFFVYFLFHTVSSGHVFLGLTLEKEIENKK